MKNELKKLGREIAKYPDSRFFSNDQSSFPSKLIKLSYQIDSRGDVNQRMIDDAKKDLEILKSGQNIFWGACV